MLGDSSEQTELRPTEHGRDQEKSHRAVAIVTQHFWSLFLTFDHRKERERVLRVHKQHLLGWMSCDHIIKINAVNTSCDSRRADQYCVTPHSSSTSSSGQRNYDEGTQRHES